ncbi:MAG TPA: DNA methyltransferase, partial [Solirubrobacteraceae bacterium]|nr:DNA methyltransferase [Solirubrobacteraceae bacterium]
MTFMSDTNGAPLRRFRDCIPLDDDLVIEGDNLDVLPRLPDGAFDLIYIDPPFNTGRTQARGERGYEDAFDDYAGFLRPRLEHARRLLAEHGTLYVHLDPRESHYVKVMLDGLFGRDCFLNEIVWAYDYGARTKRRWPAKHDTILVYVRDRARYWFDAEAVDREPYMAPGLQRSAERAARGKLPTSVWWHTIVPTTSREKTGYPTQKPEGIVRRIVAASSRPGGWCLDFFAGSGTLGAVCARLG